MVIGVCNHRDLFINVIIVIVSCTSTLEFGNNMIDFIGNIESACFLYHPLPSHPSPASFGSSSMLLVLPCTSVQTDHVKSRLKYSPNSYQSMQNGGLLESSHPSPCSVLFQLSKITHEIACKLSIFWEKTFAPRESWFLPSFFFARNIRKLYRNDNYDITKNKPVGYIQMLNFRKMKNNGLMQPR